MIINKAREAKPILWESKKSVAAPTMSGARKAVAVEDRANRPKNWVAISGGEIRAIIVRDEDRPVTKNMAKT